jgi:hypothetical protein
MSYRRNTGERLYDLLPAVYRVRDLDDDPSRSGHLEAYLDATGGLLDLIRHTLEQLHDDAFPDSGAAPRLCQDWTLPYLAELVAARLRAPFPDGQRAELANAVRWAQRKGTLTAIEEIAEAILQTEAQVQEGWRRVAITARPDRPLPSARSMGEPVATPPDAAAEPGWTHQDAARHPGLPAATVDLPRCVPCGEEPSRRARHAPGRVRRGPDLAARRRRSAHDARPGGGDALAPARTPWRALLPRRLRGRLGPHRGSALSRARPAARPLPSPSGDPARPALARDLRPRVRDFPVGPRPRLSPDRRARGRGGATCPIMSCARCWRTARRSIATPRRIPCGSRTT